MNKKILVSIGLGACIVLGGMNFSLASDDKVKTKGLNAAVVEQANIINKLIDLGDARKDPILLLAAAKLQKTMSEEAAPASDESSATKDILARVKKTAKGRKDIAGIADDIAAAKSKYWSTGDHSGFTNREWNRY
ncbi:hypothetical protein [Mariprofundus sp. KV]|uniref:hypothetical protein n=1 Tax=Mariprofundus sp. KV TaxID=2608715 RepID=UPI00159F726D|nr:hypothetical protein [Mariprofundus sp. KV]NWF35144.1 hypothetical protein [Mariprofundus sp. KV]